MVQVLLFLIAQVLKIFADNHFVFVKTGNVKIEHARSPNKKIGRCYYHLISKREVKLCKNQCRITVFLRTCLELLNNFICLPAIIVNKISSEGRFKSHTL